MNKKFTADFETATWLEKATFVWAWAVCEIGNEENIEIGTSIDSFIDYIKQQNNSIFYFHNAKFDSEFIIYWLLKNGFEHIEDKKDIKSKTFTTLINNMGQFYSMTIYFEKGNKRVKKITIIDSLKIIPMAVEKIPKAFNLEEEKLKIDYYKIRKEGEELTEEEKDYIKHDVIIVAKALKIMFDEGLTKMTVGSNALSNYKDLIGNKNFNKFFPVLDKEVDADIRSSYKRWVYLPKPYI